MQSKRLIILLLLGLTVIRGAPTEVDAYVVKGPHVIDLMVRNMGEAQTLEIDQTLFLHTQDYTQRVKTVRETVKYDIPLAFRSDISTARIKQIHLASQGDVCTMLDGKIVFDDLQPPNNVFDLYKDVLLLRSGERLRRHLKKLGMDIAISSLGRFQNRIFYVVGAQYPDARPMQLWVDRETLRPWRWVLPGKNKDGVESKFEIRYLEWKHWGQNSKTGFWHPMRVRFFWNDRLTREIVVNKVKPNPKFRKTVFDIAYLKSQYPQQHGGRMDLSGPSEIDEIKKTIQDFQRLYRQF